MTYIFLVGLGVLMFQVFLPIVLILIICLIWIIKIIFSDEEDNDDFE